MNYNEQAIELMSKCRGCMSEALHIYSEWLERLVARDNPDSAKVIEAANAVIDVIWAARNMGIDVPKELVQYAKAMKKKYAHR